MGWPGDFDVLFNYWDSSLPSLDQSYKSPVWSDLSLPLHESCFHPEIFVL